MRASFVAALLTPLIVHCITQTSSPPRRNNEAAVPQLEPDHQRGTSTFEIPCQADDEAFLFTLQAPGPVPASTSCSQTQFRLNGQTLDQEWTVANGDLSGTGRSTILVKSTVNDLDHSLELSFDSTCSATDALGPGEVRDLSVALPALQSTVIKINRIDDVPVKSETAFSVTFDRSKSQILSIVIPPIADAEHQHDSPIPQSLPVEEHTHDAPQANVDEEAGKLKDLENQLQELRQIVEAQKNLVEHLASDPPRPKCVIEKIVEKAKGCAHTILYQLSPNRHPSAPQYDCSRGHSRQFSMLASLGVGKHCPEVLHTELDDDPKKTPESSIIDLDNAGDEHQNSTRSSTSAPKATYKASAASPQFSTSPFQSSRPSSKDSEQFKNLQSGSGHRSYTTHEYILVPLGVLASIFCVGCVTAKIHHNCCSPRARSERLARREERRTRRQYKCLARRQAWRQWWDRRLHRNTVPSSSDYEEKRGLIMAQEGILESAMQEEIRRLRLAQSGVSREVPSTTDGGRMFTESLPPYSSRSRAGSGRPPSYTSETDRSPSDTLVGSSIRSSIREDVFTVGDTTPDSSVVSISPRHSSETLRTERSIV